MIEQMRTRVTVQGFSVTEDGYGNHLSTWEDILTCWAGISDATADETEAAANTVGKATLCATVRWCPALSSLTSTKNRLLIDGRPYNITHVDWVGRGNRTIKLWAREEEWPDG